LRGPHELEHLRVGQLLDAPLAALRLVVEHHRAVAKRDVVLANGGEAIGLVLLGVPLRADAKEATVEQLDGAGQHTLARHLVERQVARGALDSGNEPLLVAHLAVGDRADHGALAL